MIKYRNERVKESYISFWTRREPTITSWIRIRVKRIQVLKKLFTLFTTINKIKNKFTVKSGKYLWFPTVYFVMLTMLT